MADEQRVSKAAESILRAGPEQRTSAVRLSALLEGPEQRASKILLSMLVPDVRLVMHGSSSVPQELVAAVNKYGGNMPNAMGVPVESIQEGIRKGIRKINVDTDTRLAATATIRRIFHEEPSVFDPREYLGPARDAIYEVVKARMQAFGSAGHNDDYAPITLADTRRAYGAA